MVADGIAEIRQDNQAAMAEHCGPDHTSMLAHGYAFCSAQDGHFVGIEFATPVGSTVRVSMPTAWVIQFFDELKLAVETAAVG